MKYLAYTTYCSGRSGLSNNIMSLEIGAILAHLTNRVLVLEGNVSPPANVVQYPGLISNSQPSTVTDLIELPVPWMEAKDIDLTRFDSKEWTSHSLAKSVFYYPPTLEVDKEDFQSFARGRKYELTYSDNEAEATVLSMSGGPGVGPHQYKMWNFTFYSYFLYLDPPHQQQVFDLLKRIIPKKPYRDFTNQVVLDLGPFNAVHIRRGDFKQTFGVTTLDRTPQEALEVLEHHFPRDERLVILTDEINDPFFKDIVGSYPNNVFLDQFILDHYREAFLELPQHDSISLAFLSQLIAAESQDFIGSMTSTFTSLIQRYRGNTGKVELFKFLWNELPEKGMTLERGRHPVSQCIPMKHGVMIEESPGPYSWNRYHQRINPAWMREWPESFLVKQDTPPAPNVLEPTSSLTSQCRDFSSPKTTESVNAETQNLLKMQGSVLTYKGQVFAFICPTTQQSTELLASLRTQGWATFSKAFINLNVKTGELGPFPNAVPGREIFARAFLILDGHSSSPTELVPCSPGVAVGEILSLSAKGSKDREKIIECLCDLIPNISVYRLSYSTNSQVVELLTHTFCDESIPPPCQSHVETTIMKASTQSNDSPPVQVQISLTGGHQITAKLPKGSPILKDLYSALDGQGDSSHNSSPKVFHVPLNGNGSVCSFSRDQLVCMVTDSSVVPQEEEPILKIEPPQFIPSHFVQIDNFLTESERNQLLAFALEHEADLVPGKVTGNTPDYRKSQVHYSFNESALSSLIVDRVRSRLPELLTEFNVSSYSVKHIEAQLTASNDGDFFKIHNDNGFREGKSRELTYVYYFYREPRPFIGGELILYDGKIENNTYASADTYKVIEPRNNSIVFFLSGCLHEVLHVRCPSQAFANSRFTVNGWVQRQKMLPPTGLPDSIKEWAKNLN